MPSLPQEIIENIIYRLPAKTIGRCRCVSKAWLAHLTKPHFIKTHLKQTLKQPTQSLLLYYNSDELFTAPLSSPYQLLDEMPSLATKLDLPFKPGEWYETMAPCDGLVLISDNGRDVWLINPTTRASRAVPYSPFAADEDSVTMYGLGYDEVGDDYKVVSLSYYNTDNGNEPDCTDVLVSVFSVETGAWKRVESSPYDHAVGHVTSGVFVGGCVHWLASETDDYTSTVIAAFSLLDEEFYEVPPPSSIEGGNFVLDRLAVLGGCLCIAPYRSNKETDVWVMKEYGVQESWTKFTIVEPEGTEFRPLCLLEKDRVVLIKDEDTADEKLVIYDVKEGNMKEIVVNGIPGYFHTGGTYVESLVSPDWCNEAGNE